MAAKVKKMLGFGSHGHNEEEVEQTHGGSSEGSAAGGGEERRPKFADEKAERKPRFSDAPASPSGKKQTKKVVTVEVPSDGGAGSKHKPTSVKNKKTVAPPQAVRGPIRAWEWLKTMWSQKMFLLAKRF